MASASALIVRCFIKADTSGAIEVKVPPSVQSEQQLRKTLEKEQGLKGILSRCYPKGNWGVADGGQQAIKFPLQSGATIILGLANEQPQQEIAIQVRHMPHHKVVTNAQVHFTEAGGKKPVRLLFCEFIDNAIEAMRRMRDQGTAGPSSGPPAAAQKSTIEVHLVYKNVAHDYLLNTPTKLQVGRCPHAQADSLRACPPMPRLSLSP